MYFAVLLVTSKSSNFVLVFWAERACYAQGHRVERRIDPDAGFFERESVQRSASVPVMRLSAPQKSKSTTSGFDLNNLAARHFLKILRVQLKDCIWCAGRGPDLRLVQQVFVEEGRHR